LIRLVVALPAEARPLIRRFGLARVQGGVFPVWRTEGVSLVVSGVGQLAAESATTHLAGEGHPEGAAWLNVGIGGHRDLPLGALVLAHKVADGAGGNAWFLEPLPEPPCATATVKTVGRAETCYPEDTVYEMEAAGFCKAATRFARPELIQVVKVISDNRAAPSERLTADRVEELIEGRIETIELIAETTAARATSR
jgi:nucleoside phosphorylase